MVRAKDRGRSREAKALRRQQKLEAQWGPEQLDQSWMKWARCVLCQQRFCVNNYEDKKIRDTRLFGRWVCPWCMSKGGKANLQRFILIERLMREGRCLTFDDRGRPGDGDPKICKCAYHTAKRLFGA